MEPNTGDSRWPLLFLKVFFLIVAVIFVGGYFYFSYTKSSHITHNARLYLSLAEGDGLLGIYTLDPQSQSISHLIPSQASQTEADITSSISPDRTKIAYGSFVYSGGTNSGPVGVPGIPKLMIADADGSNATAIDLPSQVKVVRSPQWSKDGQQLIFGGREVSGGTDVPEEWNTYIYDLGSRKVSLVTPGANAFFNSEGQIIVLKNNGFYAFVLTTKGDFGGAPYLIMSQPSTRNRMTISPDDSFVAVTFPDESKVSLMKINSVKSLNITDQTQIPLTGYWPVFSPDSGKLALVGINAAGSNVVNIVDTNSKSIVETIPLQNYKSGNVFLTDWR